MPKITSLADLDQLSKEIAEKRNQETQRGVVYISVGMASCGIAAGALEVFRALEEEIKNCHLGNAILFETGCLGLCSHEPIVEVRVGESLKAAYGHVNPELAKRIIREHVLEGKVIEEFTIDASAFPTP
ncbi:MAG TPA: (2Fe-2S) ferredoxin domain-containing protein [Anaerolineales bacterium]|nr:(2Fe-2S) ferredoxin domain-containing protein [Anaerolineales bacterium]